MATSKKLVVHVHPDFLNHASIVDLIEKGHVVCPLVLETDLILHPQAQNWTMERFQLKSVWTAILKKYRQIKYPKQPKPLTSSVPKISKTKSVKIQETLISV